ncbi:MAG: hypothetical protein O3A29_07485 [Planctomycetota bacterium]|nr:hypothetical protein [Planctomycetota bacterium]
MADDDFEHEPIGYSKSEPDNAVSRLFAEISAGEKSLTFDPHFGYLTSLLHELAIPVSSQSLVFSKTSLQRNRISPRHPRSLYFNDDVYVGFCQSGDVLEISAVDSHLGTVFYTIDQTDRSPPRLQRQTDSCLICHGSSHTKGVPGHLLRSVFTDPAGNPVLASGTYRINQSSPFKLRWGGWYVTGEHGDQKHLGNLIVRDQRPDENIDNSAGQNLTDLGTRLKVENFLTPHSDIVALLVLEHQTEAHNLLTRANFTTRQALHLEAQLNRELKESPDKRWASTQSRMKSVLEPLIEYLFYCDEAPLTSPVKGTSEFAVDFTANARRDRQNRSLRDFDLTTRVFKYPLSYLIYSESFQQLPSEAKEYVMRRMWDILSGKEQSEKYDHLTPEVRRAIREIILATMPSLPDYYYAPVGS